MAVFIAAFNLPAAGLKTVVKTILDRLGMAGLVTNIVIPDLYVRANEYEMTWTATYSKTTGSFTGSMYIVTQDMRGREFMAIIIFRQLHFLNTGHRWLLPFMIASRYTGAMGRTR